MTNTASFDTEVTATTPSPTTDPAGTGTPWPVAEHGPRVLAQATTRARLAAGVGALLAVVLVGVSVGAMAGSAWGVVVALALGAIFVLGDASIREPEDFSG